MADWKNDIEVASAQINVIRTIKVHELTDQHGVMKWRVTSADGDRPPYLTKYFDTPESAYSFFRKLKGVLPNET